MAQRKGNLPVADSRSLEERNEEDQDGCCVPWQGSHGPSNTGESSFFTAEGGRGRDPELVCLS